MIIFKWLILDERHRVIHVRNTFKKARKRANKLAKANPTSCFYVMPIEIDTEKLRKFQGV